jgi:hypothetical protein
VVQGAAYRHATLELRGNLQCDSIDAARAAVQKIIGPVKLSPDDIGTHLVAEYGISA